MEHIKEFKEYNDDRDKLKKQMKFIFSKFDELSKKRKKNTHEEIKAELSALKDAYVYDKYGRIVLKSELDEANGI
jgi:hypothetical protein